jgi:hypothetical protein
VIRIDAGRRWKDLFLALQGFEHLESVDLYSLSVGHDRPRSRPRRFLGLKDGMVEGMKMMCRQDGSAEGVEYAGSEMKKVLGMLAQAIED